MNMTRSTTRLENVCQGNEEEIHGIFATAIEKELSVDVSVAFLQGDSTDRDVYVIPPKKFVWARPEKQEAISWKIIRLLYV